MDNLAKHDYSTILSLGNEDDFLEKMRLEEDSWQDVAAIPYEAGDSLLKRTLAYGKFGVAHELIDAGAQVNVVDDGGNNEFIILAPKISQPGAVEVAGKLLARDVSLEQVDKSFANTAMFSLLMEGLKKPSPEVEQFLLEAMERFTAWDHENNRGLSVRSLVERRGSEAMQKTMAEVAGGC